MLLHVDPHEPTTSLDISSRDCWAKSPVERDDTFRRLRVEAPVSWHRPTETSLPPEVHRQARFDDDAILSTILLSIAGNDTTKQTTTHTIVQLDRSSQQKAWLLEDLEGRMAGAIEEFVRHASPVISFTRTATESLELRGQRILAGACAVHPGPHEAGPVGAEVQR